ncbi:MAG: hypothetical protein WAO35_04645 [Terriglobia bacterium]
MATIMQWIHLMAAVVAVGGMGFLLLILIPSLEVLSAEQRNALSKAMAVRFRWVTWSACALLLISGLYNIRVHYWEVPWGRAWNFLTLKILLAFTLFCIVLALTIPFKLFEPLRARRRMWLLVAFILGVVVVLISAYLRPL